MTSAEKIYDTLVHKYDLIGQTGNIQFTMKNLSVQVKTKDSVGNLIQEWFQQWLIAEGIPFKENPSSQKFPDFFLNPDNDKTDLLEVKCFDHDRGPGFDLANFDSYCNSLLDQSYRLDSDYLIFSYSMDDEGKIEIKNIWLKKIWELSCSSGTYPIKVQEKKQIIYNIRPATWFSDRSTFKPFGSIEKFLSALDETRYLYPQTRGNNGHWLKKVLADYAVHTNCVLTVPRYAEWVDAKA